MIYLTLGGNIGSGKSSVLAELKEALAKEYKIRALIVPEPVGLWGPALGLFYDEPEKQACKFQQLVISTRLLALLDIDAAPSDIDVIIVERCLDEDELFARCSLSEEDFKIFYTPTLEVARKIMPTPDGQLWLDAPPKVCYDRVMERQRSEEMSGGVTPEYLATLHREYINLYGANPSVVRIDAAGALPAVIKTVVDKIANVFPLPLKVKGVLDRISIM